MNTLVGGKGGGKGAATIQQNNKENVKPTDDNKDKKPTRDKHICPHCKIKVLYKAANCLELEENTHRRWKGWKLVNDTA